MYNPIMRTRSVLSLLVLAVGMAGVSSRAQDAWVARPSGTTANLWSVAFAANQWVAVGEQGTILTSPDGTAWTARSFGFPTTWLVAVGYGAGTWTVVGDNGLILTSTDTLTWTTRNSRTTSRLNGVAYGGGRWMVVAESGELLTSADSITWSKLSPSTDRLRGILYAYGQFVITGDNGLMRTTIDATDYAANVLPGGFFVESAAYGRRSFIAVGEDGFAITSTDAVTWTRLASSTTNYLHGITFFNGQFIAVGASGTILSTPAAGTAWTARNSGTSQLLIATAASESAVVAVGFGGTISRSSPPAAAPTIATNPRSVRETAGSNVLLEVTATGSLPLAYRWLFNGQPLAGQTSERLLLTNVQSTEAGSYTVTVTNALGSATSTAATLQLAADTKPTAIVDPTFNPTIVLSNSSITAAVEQADGKIIIGGANFFATAGVSPFNLARLNVDGSLDSSFNIGTGLSGGASVTNLVAQPDGRVLVSGSFQSVNGIARTNLARLNADGSLDAAFTAASSAVTQPAAKMALLSDGKIIVLNGTQLFRLNPDGSSDAAFTGATNGFATSIFTPLTNGQILAGSSRRIIRLNTNGAIDSTFTAVSDFLIFNSFRDLQLAPDGNVFLAEGVLANFGYTSMALRRYRVDGGFDSTWPGLYANGGYRGDGALTANFDTKGNIFLSTKAWALGSTPTRKVLRYKPDAALDYTFDAGAGPNGDVSAILPLRDGRVIVAGAFTSFDGVARPKLVRLLAANAPDVRLPTIVAVTPEAVSVLPGAPVSLTVSAAGSGPLTYTWSSVVPTAQTTNTAVSVPTNISGTYTATVTVTNRAGSVTSAPVRIVVAPSAPVLTAAPASLTASTGRTAVFNVAAAGSAPFTYQWFRGTTPVGTGTTLTLNPVTTADAGDYTVVVTNSLGSTRSSVAKLTVDSSARLANISTRAGTGPGDSTLIAGFVITGASAKKVLIRGIGPSLSAFGLGGLLPNPKITLYDGDRRVIATNDDFDRATTPNGLASGVSGFPLSNPTDAALVATLVPGNYTVQVTDSAARSGVALVEVYAADTTDNRISSLSSRAFVGAGPAIGICGITVEGERPRQFLIRAVGPTLSEFNVGDTLPDPFLTLTTASGVPVASNDNWGSVGSGSQISAATAAVGAFALPAASKDSALLITLAPGNYTALISGVNDVTGVAIIEVYEMPLPGP